MNQDGPGAVWEIAFKSRQNEAFHVLVPQAMLHQAHGKQKPCAEEYTHAGGRAARSRFRILSTVFWDVLGASKRLYDVET